MQVSAAEKKKQLNSKGEKGRDLLDVFTQPEPKEARDGAQPRLRQLHLEAGAPRIRHGLALLCKEGGLHGEQRRHL